MHTDVFTRVCQHIWWTLSCMLSTWIPRRYGHLTEFTLCEALWPYRCVKSHSGCRWWKYSSLVWGYINVGTSWLKLLVFVTTLLSAVEPVWFFSFLSEIQPNETFLFVTASEWIYILTVSKLNVCFCSPDFDLVSVCWWRNRKKILNLLKSIALHRLNAAVVFVFLIHQTADHLPGS